VTQVCIFMKYDVKYCRLVADHGRSLTRIIRIALGVLSAAGVLADTYTVLRDLSLSDAGDFSKLCMATDEEFIKKLEKEKIAGTTTIQDSENILKMISQHYKDNPGPLSRLFSLVR
jgi:hypothetical protein